MQFVRYLGFDLSDFFREGFEDSIASFAGSLDFAVGCFDPADGGREVNAHEVVIFLVHKGDRVTYVFFVTDLMVLGILIESSFVFADNGIVLVVVAFASAAHQRELKIGAIRQGQQKHQ